MKKQINYIELAECLFDMERDTIYNDLQFYKDFCGWGELFGDKLDQAIKTYKIPYENYDVLATMIKSDHDNGLWIVDKNNELYDYQMRDEYGGYIENCIKKQLAKICGTNEVKKHKPTQKELMQFVLDSGVNLVTCGNCGDVLLHQRNDIEISCPHCQYTSEPCDFPDLIID